ncbi:MAG: TetR/AcrR family transcriptional regulator [Acidimicrobiales bacterium]
MGHDRAGSTRPGRQTRDRIIDAALETVLVEGLVGTSARAIARTGQFNQALVFYHFGSVDELLLAALERANERRMDRFADRLAGVDTLVGIVGVAAELHRGDVEADQHALSAIVAGWAARSELAPRIRAVLAPWDDLVAGALDRSLAGSPLAQVVPTGELAHLLSALFLGIEVMSRIEQDDAQAPRLFDTVRSLSGMVGTGTPAPTASDGSGDRHPDHDIVRGPGRLVT